MILLKGIILTTLTITTSLTVLLMRLSRIQAESDENLYLPSTVVFLTECHKFILCIISLIVVKGERSILMYKLINVTSFSRWQVLDRPCCLLKTIFWAAQGKPFGWPFQPFCTQFRIICSMWRLHSLIRLLIKYVFYTACHKDIRILK